MKPCGITYFYVFEKEEIDLRPMPKINKNNIKIGERIRNTIAATNIQIIEIMTKNGTPIKSNPRNETTNSPTAKLKNKPIAVSRKPAKPFMG